MAQEDMAQEGHLDSAGAWQLLLALRRLAVTTSLPLGLDAAGRPTDQAPLLTLGHTDWQCNRPLTDAARQLLELYLPLFQPQPQRGWVLAHLGQSLDGCIAAADGSSAALNDAPNLDHMHRLRALGDAILVGAGTVAADDPRLTTRRVAGDNPVRVVLDPWLRSDPDRILFNDSAAPTLLVCHDAAQPRRMPDQIELLRVGGPTDRLDLTAVLAVLHERGLRRIFIEGGGVTVSRFLHAGLLDYLQITVAPLLLGRGRPGLQLPTAATMAEGLRPVCRRFTLGCDVLFEFDLRAQSSSADGQANRSR